MSHIESDARPREKTRVSEEYDRQARKLSLRHPPAQNDGVNDLGRAVEANFVTPLDPVIETIDGNRLPVIPVEEAYKINMLKDKLEGKKERRRRKPARGLSRFEDTRPRCTATGASKHQKAAVKKSETLDEALAPTKTHPLFPPLPLYGPPSVMRDLQCCAFRITSLILSTGFLLVVVLGAIFTSIPKISHYLWLWFTFENPDKRRPHHEEEHSRALKRRQQEKTWCARSGKNKQPKQENAGQSNEHTDRSFQPLEGGPDPLVCDVRYYARRVGLDMEEFKVQTEDGFIISLWHVFNPAEYRPASQSARKPSSPIAFAEQQGDRSSANTVAGQYMDGGRRYPVLLVHGLLQSAGAYCCNDDESLAFYLCKSGYDVWLGNNRCGFQPEHTLLDYKDPRMWAWNIRQMGVMDLPAFVSRVLKETGFERLGLVCHSQGTTQTFVALAKEQRPELGEKLSVFCALAPAVYAGPLIDKMYFKFMQVISPSMFRIFFGIHAFIPLMMTMHRWLPGKIYGFMGYQVFSFLFNWTDNRWDRGLRDRLFQFSPVYVSSESMRWWLGRECFAKQRCILSTRQIEDIEDDEESNELEDVNMQIEELSRKAWYSDQMPPLALWIAGSDDLVDGRRLLRRLKRGREPHVDVVHAKVIDEYEHLDVLWAIDTIEKVGKEVRDVIWQTMNDRERSVCRIVEGVCDSDSDSEDETDSERTIFDHESSG